MRTGLACVLSSLLVCDGFAQSQDDVSHRALAREILQELVEISTTEAEGTRRAAEALAKRLASEGFQKEDVHILGPDPKTASLVARFRGRGSAARPILLMAHLDVVPARREDWSVDPWR